MKTIEIEGKSYQVPDWVQWVAQESDGEWTGFDEKPLCKMPYGFWKAQGIREAYDICQGTPYEDDPGEVEKHLWRVEDLMNKWEKAGREWLKGCSCAGDGNPEDCPECTKAFLDHLKRLGTEN